MRKILVFLLCFSTIFLCFVIPSFADASEGFFTYGEEFVFNSSLESSLMLPNSVTFLFDSNGDTFESIHTSYRGYLVVYYDDLEVYNDSGWVDDSYRYLISNADQTISYDLHIFLTANEYHNTMYDNIFVTVRDSVFGSRPLTESEDITVTLISTVFCILVVALPIIVIYMLLKFFVGTIARY